MTTYSNYNSYIRSKQSGGCWPQGPQGPQGFGFETLKNLKHKTPRGGTHHTTFRRGWGGG